MPVWSKHLHLPNDIHAYHTYQHLNWTCIPSPTLTPPGNHQIFIKFSYRLFQFLVLCISLMCVCLMLCLTKLWGHHIDFLSKQTLSFDLEKNASFHCGSIPPVKFRAYSIRVFICFSKMKVHGNMVNEEEKRFNGMQKT